MTTKNAVRIVAASIGMTSFAACDRAQKEQPQSQSPTDTSESTKPAKEKPEVKPTERANLSTPPIAKSGNRTTSDFLIAKRDDLKNRTDGRIQDKSKIIDPNEATYFAMGVDNIHMSNSRGEVLQVIEEGETVQFHSMEALDVFYKFTSKSWDEKPEIDQIYVLKSLKFEAVN